MYNCEHVETMVLLALGLGHLLEASEGRMHVGYAKWFEIVARVTSAIPRLAPCVYFGRPR